MTTTLVDGFSDRACPLPDDGPLDGIIVIFDRSTEIKLMDDDDSTCLGVFSDGRSFQRLVAYIYVPIPVTTLRLVLTISGMECSHPGLLVYHGNGYSDMNVECSQAASRHEGGMQQCEFLCTSICPNQSVVKIYVQTQLFPQEQNDFVSICGMVLKNWHFKYDILIAITLQWWHGSLLPFSFYVKKLSVHYI